MTAEPPTVPGPAVPDRPDATAPLPSVEQQPAAATATYPAAVPDQTPQQMPQQLPQPVPPQAQWAGPLADGVMVRSDRRDLPGRTFRELGYLVLTLLASSVAFCYVFAVVSLSAVLAVTVVGLLAVGWLVVGARAWGALFRSMGRGMLGIDVAPPPPARVRGGFWRSIGRSWGDAAGWRAMAFSVLAWVLSMVGSIVSMTFLACGLGGVTYWLWQRWLPLQQAADGTWHRGAQLWVDYFVDTPTRMMVMAAFGIVCAVACWYITRAFGHLFRLLTARLLGPTRASLRVEHLERTRSTAVQDADARLRRIERDLHDGTQARLVAVAMQLGDARDRLETVGDPAVTGLLDEAHAALKDTLTELREIARGIHPPALDDGLAVALETLAARCALPTTVYVELRTEPDPEVQAIAYYAVAELLTNAARHAGAAHADVVARRAKDGCLHLTVTDDGHGGARPALPTASGGTGLAGLMARVSTVDGTVDIDSPVGGPTVVAVVLPMATRR